MLAKIILIISAVVCVNSQLLLPGAPACGCNGPLMNPPCGPLEFLAPVSPAPPAALPAALAAQILLQKGAVTAPTCGCNAALPSQLLTSAALPVIPEVVMNAPLALSPPCGCSAPCGCRQDIFMSAMPVGCTNPFLPAASPVSAMAPQVVSPLLPPVCPSENKCLYLRKIPIPPPSL